MSRWVISLAGLLLFLGGALRAMAADPVVVPLADDLSYLRISGSAASDGDLAQALATAGALVVDLRQVPADRGTQLLKTLVEVGPRKSATLVLIGPATPPELADGLTRLALHPLTLGIAGTKPTPDVSVAQSAEAEAAALAELAQGTAVADLISGRIEKERYDEAALVKDFANGSREQRPPSAGPTAETAAKPPRPVDRVLQRAVQLHDALKASR